MKDEALTLQRVRNPRTKVDDKSLLIGTCSIFLQLCLFRAAFSYLFPSRTVCSTLAMVCVVFLYNSTTKIISKVAISFPTTKTAAGKKLVVSLYLPNYSLFASVLVTWS